jgi:hypothetical protein
VTAATVLGGRSGGFCARTAAAQTASKSKTTPNFDNVCFIIKLCAVQQFLRIRGTSGRIMRGLWR